MSFLAAFIMKGRMQAILLASSFSLVSLFMHPLIKPFVIIASFASIALVTLRKGGVEGVHTLLGATLVTAVLGALLVGQVEFLLLMSVSCLMMWLPIWLVSIVLRETRHLALAIEVGVFMAILGVSGFYLYSPEPALVWQQAFAPLLQVLPEDAPVEGMQNWINDTSHYMTGIFAASTLFAVVFSLFLARWWQSILFNPNGFKQEFMTLRTGSRLAIASIVIVITAKSATGWASELAWNLAISLFVLYLFIGTSVVHTLFSTMKYSKYLVPMLYITLFLVPHVMLPVATVGLCDAWLNLRKIQSTPPPTTGG